jgi:hypothetical protein
MTLRSWKQRQTLLQDTTKKMVGLIQFVWVYLSRLLVAEQAHSVKKTAFTFTEKET